MERGFTKSTKVTDEKVVRTLKDIDDTIHWVKYSCLQAYNQCKAAVNEVRFLMLGHRVPYQEGEGITRAVVYLIENGSAYFADGTGKLSRYCSNGRLPVAKSLNQQRNINT